MNLIINKYSSAMLVFLKVGWILCVVISLLLFTCLCIDAYKNHKLKNNLFLMITNLGICAACIFLTLTTTIV